LGLLALGSRLVDGVDFICEHDGPDGIATETDSCATEYDDGYGCTRVSPNLNPKLVSGRLIEVEIWHQKLASLVADTTLYTFVYFNLTPAYLHHGMLHTISLDI
ncbi:hypothetical protein KCU62_g348, partial [Aureobasidium sp. EXF-3399]